MTTLSIVRNFTVSPFPRIITEWYAPLTIFQLTAMQLTLFKFLFVRRPAPVPQPVVAVAKSKRRITNAGDISEHELKALWIGLRRHFFPDREDLDSYAVYWSTTAQKRTLASCNIERRAIRVARELNYTQHKQWLSPLLYHELCHAYLGFSVYSKEGRSNWHGSEFKKLEKRHPGIQRLDSWIKSGGWARAVRSDRAKRAFKRRIRQAS